MKRGQSVKLTEKAKAEPFWNREPKNYVGVVLGDYINGLLCVRFGAKTFFVKPTDLVAV